MNNKINYKEEKGKEEKNRDYNNEFIKILKVFRTFSIEFNKSLVLNTITTSSLNFIYNQILNTQNFTNSILAAFEEMRSTNNSISNNIKNISSEMKSIVDSNNSLNDILIKRNEEFKKISFETQKIEKMFEELIKNSETIFNATSAIFDVSDRTNVLAINASIEASHAGKYGAGFSIIANEVRKLSEQTKDFAKNINYVLNNFKNGVMQLAEYVKQINEIIQKQAEDIEYIKEKFEQNNITGTNVSNSLEEINSSMHEHNLAIKDGLENLFKLNELTKESLKLTDTLSRAYHNISDIFKEK